MATTTPSTRSGPAYGDPCVVLRDVGSGGYTALLKLRGERPSPRMIYLDGDLYLVATSAHVEFQDVGWDGYRALLRLRGERPAPKIIYLDGSLLFVSPSQPHERMKKRFGMFVAEIVTGLGIPHIPTGQMTLRRRGRRGGIEGDETYYL